MSIPTGTVRPDHGITLLQRLPLLRGGRRWLAYVLAMAISGVGALIRFTVVDALPPGFPYVTFFPAVIITAFLFGLGPGLVAALLSGLLSWYYFVPPVGSFALPYRAVVALLFYSFIVLVDVVLVHWMQRANAHALEARVRSAELAETREVLFRELQHRVGNNLQMVGAILQLQQRGVTEPEALQALKDASRRLGLVGRMQRTLYRSDGEQLRLSDYIEEVARDTVRAAGRSDIELSVSSMGNAQLRPQDAIPAALVVAEAISNAIEHGLAQRGGTIAIAMAQRHGRYEVSITDDGTGLPAGFDPEESRSLGLRIARTLAQGLGGTFRLENRADGPGARAALDFTPG